MLLDISTLTCNRNVIPSSERPVRVAACQSRDEQTFSFCFESEPFRELADVAGKTC